MESESHHQEKTKDAEYILNIEDNLLASYFSASKQLIEQKEPIDRKVYTELLKSFEKDAETKAFKIMLEQAKNDKNKRNQTTCDTFIKHLDIQANQRPYLLKGAQALLSNNSTNGNKEYKNKDNDFLLKTFTTLYEISLDGPTDYIQDIQASFKGNSPRKAIGESFIQQQSLQKGLSYSDKRYAGVPLKIYTTYQGNKTDVGSIYVSNDISPKDFTENDEQGIRKLLIAFLNSLENGYNRRIINEVQTITSGEQGCKNDVFMKRTDSGSLILTDSETYAYESYMYTILKDTNYIPQRAYNDLAVVLVTTNQDGEKYIKIQGKKLLYNGIVEQTDGTQTVENFMPPIAITVRMTIICNKNGYKLGKAMNSMQY